MLLSQNRGTCNDSFWNTASGLQEMDYKSSLPAVTNINISAQSLIVSIWTILLGVLTTYGLFWVLQQQSSKTAFGVVFFLKQKYATFRDDTKSLQYWNLWPTVSSFIYLLQMTVQNLGQFQWRLFYCSPIWANQNCSLDNIRSALLRKQSYYLSVFSTN